MGNVIISPSDHTGMDKEHNSINPSAKRAAAISMHGLIGSLKAMGLTHSQACEYVFVEAWSWQRKAKPGDE